MSTATSSGDLGLKFFLSGLKLAGGEMLSDTDRAGEPDPELEDELEEDELQPTNLSTSTAEKSLRDSESPPIELSLPPIDPAEE